jgi:hypothetical protein
MNNHIPHGALPGSDTADVFHGHAHGNVPISMFLIHNCPGDGPELHRHPYPEVFIVHGGQARFELDDTVSTRRSHPTGAGHYPVVVRKLAQMHTQEPTLSPDDLRQLQSRTLIMLGDDDEVRLERAIAMYRAIPNAELMIVPGTSHGLLVEKPGLCNEVIVTFLTTDPIPTMAPILRATPG